MSAVSSSSVEGHDLFTVERLSSAVSGDMVEVPMVQEGVYRFVDIGEDGVCTLEDGYGEHVFDFYLPDCEVGGKMQDALRGGRAPTVTTVTWNGKRRIVGIVHY